MGKTKIITTEADQTRTEENKNKEGQSVQPKQAKRQILNGEVHIFASYNNTIITITDKKGNVLGWSSAGNAGFKGTRKSTPYAATIAAKNAFEKARKYNISTINIFVRGIGQGRDAAIRSLAGEGLEINSIVDVTPIPHNGVRPKKPRRV